MDMQKPLWCSLELISPLLALGIFTISRTQSSKRVGDGRAEVGSKNQEMYSLNVSFSSTLQSMEFRHVAQIPDELSLSFVI